METINIKELRGVLLPITEEVRERLSNSHLPPVAEAHFVGMQKVLSMVLVFLSETEKQGEVDMNKLAKSLSVEIVRISDIPHTKKVSKWQPLVKETVAGLKPGQATLIDPSVITYGHLSSVLTKLRKDKEIGDNVKLVKRGEKYFLAKMDA